MLAELWHKGANGLSAWWDGYTADFKWSEPADFLGASAVVVTALIPLVLWRFSARQGRRDSELRSLQMQSLTRQEDLLRRQRRDALLSIVDTSTDPTHLGLLWREIGAYVGGDRQLLRAAFRANVSLSLPGTSTGVVVDDELTEEAVADYVAGFERRYARRESGFHPYEGLLGFIGHARAHGLDVDHEAIASLVTGPTTEMQRPGHTFYRELVLRDPDAAAALIRNVGLLDYRTQGGTRLNVLTGALLAIKDIELGRPSGGVSPEPDAAAAIRSSVPVAIVELLRFNQLRSMDRWSLEGSTEPVSATIAWLVRAVGWLADVDDHLAKRMVEALPDAILAVPANDRRWGTDQEDVQHGFDSIRAKQPELWALHGASLTSAALAMDALPESGHGDGRRDGLLDPA